MPVSQTHGCWFRFCLVDNRYFQLAHEYINLNLNSLPGRTSAWRKIYVRFAPMEAIDNLYLLNFHSNSCLHIVVLKALRPDPSKVQYLKVKSSFTFGFSRIESAKALIHMWDYSPTLH